MRIVESLGNQIDKTAAVRRTVPAVLKRNRTFPIKQFALTTNTILHSFQPVIYKVKRNILYTVL